MRHLRRLKCRIDGYEPGPGESICLVDRTHNDWEWHCDLHGLTATEDLGCDRCVYRFQGRTLSTKAEVVEALSNHWHEAVQHVQRVPLDDWAATLDDVALVAHLRRFAAQSSRYPNAALAGALAALSPDDEPTWCGRTLVRVQLRASGEPTKFRNVQSVGELVGGPLPGWTKHLPKYQWLTQVQVECQKRGEILGIADLSAATQEQWWWLLAESHSVRTIALSRKATFVGVNDPSLADIFAKDEINDVEAFRLATADTGKFVTPRAAWGTVVTTTEIELGELRKRAEHRPSSRQELEALQTAFEDCLVRVRKFRDRMRGEFDAEPEPIQLFRATDSVRVALRRTLAAREQSEKLVRECQSLVERGHARLALARAAEIRAEVAEFHDLDLSFVQAAESRVRRAKKWMYVLCGLALSCIAFAVLLIKK